MLITVTNLQGNPFEVNPEHIVMVESVGGDQPHTKLYLSTRNEVKVSESRETIKALCNPSVTIAPLEVKAEADAQAFTEALAKTGKRERK